MSDEITVLAWFNDDLDVHYSENILPLQLLEAAVVEDEVPA
jgi:hypothetical protein